MSREQQSPFSATRETVLYRRGFGNVADSDGPESWFAADNSCSFLVKSSDQSLVLVRSFDCRFVVLCELVGLGYSISVSLFCVNSWGYLITVLCCCCFVCTFFFPVN